MKCIYCGFDKLYILKTEQAKCCKCKRKFSLKKLKRKSEIIECFCDNLTVNSCAKKIEVNYKTIKKEYDDIRKNIAIFLEKEFQNKTVIEYDEYVYLENSKKKDKKYIFDANNFITFHYDDKIFNLLMSNLNKYKAQFLEDGLDDAYFREFSKFMMFNKISKLQKKENLIVKFWLFFEKFILKYKGVKSENFFYYLKEAEFKFNYPKGEQLKIILDIS